MKIHCLFEQSGTFRDTFRKLGYEAYDYDIENQFGKTDYQIDLFDCIREGIFDFITENDFVFAFFPCTYFSAQKNLIYKMTAPQFAKYTELNKIDYNRKLFNNLSEYYNLFLNFYEFLLKNKIKAVIENPYSPGNFLSRYFPIEPQIIIPDRTVYGDFFKKPTQFFFVNFKPGNNLMGCYYFKIKKKIVKTSPGIFRSLITSEFAENFIEKYLMEILEK